MYINRERAKISCITTSIQVFSLHPLSFSCSKTTSTYLYIQFIIQLQQNTYDFTLYNGTVASMDKQVARSPSQGGSTVAARSPSRGPAPGRWAAEVAMAQGHHGARRVAVVRGYPCRHQRVQAVPVRLRRAPARPPSRHHQRSGAAVTRRRIAAASKSPSRVDSFSLFFGQFFTKLGRKGEGVIYKTMVKWLVIFPPSICTVRSPSGGPQ